MIKVEITPAMKKMLWIVGIFFALVFGFYGVKKAFLMYFLSHYQPPAVTISSTTARVKTWQSYLEVVGTLAAINGVDLTAEVSGLVKTIQFNSGQYVKKGDVIIALDTSVEEAELKSNEANLQLAQMDYAREQTLFTKKVTSKASLDTRYAQLLEAQASVESSQAKIRQKTITAPFDGRLGIRLVDLGQYTSPGQNMVTLQALNPLYVNLSVPEQYLPNLYLDQPVDVNVNFGEGKIVPGHITAINSKVDQATRNVSIQATIPNDQQTLYPGMFALAKVWMKAKQNIVVIPQTAVSYSLSGDFVYLIKTTGDGDKKEMTAERQYVKVGERRGDEVSIVEGLKGNEQIITSGQLKLQNHARVEINNSVEL